MKNASRQNLNRDQEVQILESQTVGAFENEAAAKVDGSASVDVIPANQLAEDAENP